MGLFEEMRSAAKDQVREQQQIGFQERIVKQLLRKAGVEINVAALKREAGEQRNTSDLSFDWFNENFPRFPLRLLSQKLKYTQLASIGQLYGKNEFKKLPWWQEYLQQTGLYGLDLTRQRAALLFNLPFAKDAYLMVVHNQPVQEQVIRDAELRQDEPWPRTTFPIGKTGLVAVLEAFDSFIQTVGSDWAEQ